MKINNIRIKNFRGLRDVDVSLETDLTVFVGNNGAGKSSVLDAIGICLSWVIARIISAKGQGKLIHADELSNGATHGQIEATFDNIHNLRVVNKAIKGIEKKVTSDLESLNNYAAEMRGRIEGSDFKTNIPVVVHYGVSRVVVDIPLRIKNKHAFDLLETYTGSLNGSANFRDFFEWFRNQEDLENERYRQDDTIGEPFQRELNAVRNALSRFMPEYTDLHVRRNPLRMVVRKNNQELRVDQLSDGEKCYMAMVGDLCRRLVLANPQMEDPLQGEGIVMIDELELHLH
ncbi:MAG: AAA family ATPase, partial [Bacteroidales bacterium]